MKKSISLVLLLLFTVTLSSTAQFITIREGSAPVIDGSVAPGEWSDADSVQLTLNASARVTVKFKHDGQQFYFVYAGRLESFNVRFPELLLDVDNNKSAGWSSDNWWFHVSATDCESNTAAGDYSNCLAVQPDWTAVNNITQGAPLTDTVGIAIPFSKIGFAPAGTDTIGIALDVSNTFNAWNYWPTGVSASSPATWGNGIVQFSATALPETPSQKLRPVISPNPVTSTLRFSLPGWPSGTYVAVIRDLTGRVRDSEPLYVTRPAETITLPLGNLTSGIYFLEIINGERRAIERFLVRP